MLRVLVASFFGAAAAIFGFVGGRGVTGSWLGAAAMGTVTTILVVLWFRRQASPWIEAMSGSRLLEILSVVAMLVALVLLARQAIFAIDPSKVRYSFIPGSTWEVQHSCLTAYHVAAEASSSGTIYDNALYSMPDDDPSQPRKARMLGPFTIDVFEYPPPFLLLPRALHVVTPDFADLRMLWFALSGLTLLLAIPVVASLLDPPQATRALLLSPLVWIALPTVSVLQKSNVQLLVIAGSMLAMVLFERRRWAAGGAILALVTVSKLYPGLLVLFLLARRQWKAVAWTAGMAAAFNLWTLAVFGWTPYAAFLDHLPGLLSGEAFPAFRRPAAVARNLSIPGLVFKLKLFGIEGLSFGASKIVGWAYTVLAAVAVVFAALRPARLADQPLVWLGILILATLRSPFLPVAYAALPAVWLLTLLGAPWTRSAIGLLALLAGWLALSVYWPIDWPMDPRWVSLLMVVPQAGMVVLAVLAFRRSPGLASGRSA